MLDSDVSTVISVLATFISVMYAFHYTGKRREAKLQSAGKHILCPTEEAVTQALHELTDLAAEELLIPRKNLTRDAHFIERVKD